jgi:hypothetical protein
MKQTAVDWIIEEINQQQKRYIDLAKKDKSLKKEVDAILTSTTLLKIKCEQAKEMEKEQIEDAFNNARKNKSDCQVWNCEGTQKAYETFETYWKVTFKSVNFQFIRNQYNITITFNN